MAVAVCPRPLCLTVTHPNRNPNCNRNHNRNPNPNPNPNPNLNPNQVAVCPRPRCRCFRTWTREGAAGRGPPWFGWTRSGAAAATTRRLHAQRHQRTSLQPFRTPRSRSAGERVPMKCRSGRRRACAFMVHGGIAQVARVCACVSWGIAQSGCQYVSKALCSWECRGLSGCLSSPIGLPIADARSHAVCVLATTPPVRGQGRVGRCSCSP